ncbi:potassium channel family protein [Vulcanisaeta sp. JCM 14467]
MVIPITVLRILRRVRRIARSLIFYSLILFLVVLFVGALIMYLIEHGKNPGFNNYFNAVWFVVETITTVGYGDIVPNTYLGKLADMVIMPVGIAVISLLTASIATELTNIAITRSMGHHMTSKGGHVIIIGDVDRALRVINVIIELMRARGKIIDILYIGSGERPPSLPTDVEFIRGDPFNTKDLLRAGVDRASTVVVLPFNDADAKAADAKVVLLIMSIRKLNSNTYIIAEVLNESDREYALRAGANSVISLGSFTTVLMANEVFNHGLSSALISIINSGNLDLISADEYIGRRFMDVVQTLKMKLNYLAIGVVRGNEVILNPVNDFIIQSGDSLIIIK